jgi:hypothetical protein
MLFYKHLKQFDVPEELFLKEIKSSKNKLWFTAKNNSDNYDLNFVKDKPDGAFYLSRLKNFPNICEYIEKNIPNVIVKNSYVTKCNPRYAMNKHIDTNRETAIIIPLGENKGILNYYYKDFLISTCVYKGPTLSRVNVVHSAVNTSDEYRYSITVEISGSYFNNFFKYR